MTDNPVSGSCRCLIARRPAGWSHTIYVPGGQCLPCRVKHRNSWTARSLLEEPFHEACSFLTLTYAEDPAPRSKAERSACYKRDIVPFLKRIRHQYYDLRFIARGEYGGQLGRFHWHLLLFGRPQEQSGLFEHPRWDLGLAYDAEFNRATVGYVNGYISKFEDDGIIKRSLRPAIGRRGLEVIAKTLCETQPFAVSPNTITISGKRYPLNAYAKATLEAHMIKLGATKVPPRDHAQVAKDTAIAYRALDKHEEDKRTLFWLRHNAPEHPFVNNRSTEIEDINLGTSREHWTKQRQEWKDWADGTGSPVA